MISQMTNNHPSRPGIFIFLAGIVAFGFAQNAGAQAQPAVAPAIQWICSTQAEPWRELPATVLLQPQGAESNVVRLDPATVYQTIDGFGGCFNELGWDALQALDAAAAGDGVEGVVRCQRLQFQHLPRADGRQ